MWMLVRMITVSLLAGLRIASACAPGESQGGSSSGVDGYPDTTPEAPVDPIHATILFIVSKPCRSITGQDGLTIQLVPGPIPDFLANIRFPRISRSLVCQLPSMANTTSSEIAGTSTTEMPTTEELITTNSVSTSTIWTTMTSMVGYSTPTTYEAMTTPSVFSHLGEGPIMLVLDRSKKTIFVGSALDLQFATHLTIPQYVDPIGMAISTSNFRVFWTDLKTNRIHGSNLFGEYPRIYSLGLFEEPVSISYIESGGLMYCAYSESNKITRLHIGYPKCEKELIMYTPKPRALAIDKSRRSLYWSRDGGIERIDLVSLRRQTIYHNPELRNITGLAVDSGSTTVIAFLDTLIHRVFYIDLSEPDNVVELTSSFPALDFPFVTQLSVFDRDMFLTTSGDAATAGANPGVFCMMNYTKDSRDLQFTAVDSLDDPVGIFIGQF